VPSYIAYSAAMPTTAAPVAVATGTAIKTIMRVTAGANNPLKVWKWGIDFDGTGTTPIKCELIHTTTVAPTDTAGAVYNYGTDMPAAASGASTGYNASAEGSVVATTRLGALQQILPGNFFSNEWSLGREFYVPPSGVLRVRVTASATVNAYAFIAWDE
jgi:hypothetical protein